MKSSKSFLSAVAFIIACVAQANGATRVDFTDPRRALGREDDIRVDAQLIQDTVSSNSPLNITWQVENLTTSPVGVAFRLADASYDADTQTITIDLGAEIPTSDAMPQLAVIGAGEKRVFSSTASVHVNVPSVRAPWTAVPRYVQIKVNVLRDLAPFATLIDQQQQQKSAALRVALPDSLFDRWVESNDTIFLNALPVSWRGDSKQSLAEAQRPSGMF